MTRWGRGILVAVLLAAGCGGIQITRGSPPPGPITAVAVLDFESQDESHAAGAADGCVMGVLEAGMRAIERRRVTEMMQEREASRSGEMGADFYRQLGEMLGVEAFLVGSIQQELGEPGSVVVRLVSAVTGDILLVYSQGSRRGGLQASDKGRNACRELLRAL